MLHVCMIYVLIMSGMEVIFLNEFGFGEWEVRGVGLVRCGYEERKCFQLKLHEHLNKESLK